MLHCMDSVRTLVSRRLKELDISLKNASERLGRNPAYLQQYLEREVPKELPESVRGNLASLLRIDEKLLRGGSSPIKEHLPSVGSNTGPAHVRTATIASPEDTILKVLGMAEGGPDGWNLWNGDVVDSLPRPANLLGVPGAYGVFVSGTSMEPRYRAGEILHIHPGKPVRPGDYVLVQRKPAHEGDPPLAVVKLLLRRTASRLILGQHNPTREIEVPAADVVSIHRVVGSSEA